MKKVVFVTSRSGGPKNLYVTLCQEFSNAGFCECHIVSGFSGWLQLHFTGYKYDVMVSSIPFFWKPLKTRFILSLNGIYTKEQGFHSLGAVISYMYSYNFLFASDIVYSSEFLKKIYEKQHTQNHIIYPLIVKQKAYLQENASQFVTVTNFSFYDKSRGVLDIFEKLEDFQPIQKIDYYIIGDGRFLETIRKKQSSYRIHEDITIHFLGNLDYQELLKYYSEKSIFLYSTFQDTFGISIVEAISAGMPVVLNDYELFEELYDKKLIAADKKVFQMNLKKLLSDENYWQENVYLGKKSIAKCDTEVIKQQWEKLLTS